jgi:hypothetical protein
MHVLALAAAPHARCVVSSAAAPPRAPARHCCGSPPCHPRASLPQSSDPAASLSLPLWQILCFTK